MSSISSRARWMRSWPLAHGPQFSRRCGRPRPGGMLLRQRWRGGGKRCLWPRRGRVAGAPRCALLIDHSTTHPELTRAHVSSSRRLGLCWVDAPVSGGIAAAKNGALAAWLGGRREDADRARAFIAAYASRINYMGLLRQRSDRKIVQSGDRRQHDCDLGRDARLTPSATVSILRHSSIRSKAAALTSECGGPSRRGWPTARFPNSRQRNMIKDLTIITDLAP